MSKIVKEVCVLKIIDIWTKFGVKHIGNFRLKLLIADVLVEALQKKINILMLKKNFFFITIN